jgi:HSP20 family molecular chaperone IbpA
MPAPLIQRRRALLPELRQRLEGGLPVIPMLSLPWLHEFVSRTFPVELAELDDAYVVRAELPGLDPDRDIELTTDAETLTIRAHHPEQPETEEEKLCSEFRYGTMERTVRLPFTVPDEGIKAAYHGGLLTIRIPAPPEYIKHHARTIPVEHCA